MDRHHTLHDGFGTVVLGLNIPLNEASLNIARQCNHELRGVLLDKFGCSITGLCLEEGQRTAAIRPEKRFETQIRSGVKVSVWKADLTAFSVVAVVNAANEHLRHCGGLAQALSEAGGPKIQKDSEDYVKAHGPLKTGNAIVSDAGLLRCQKIIHAVGPNLPPKPSKSEMTTAKLLLEQCIRSILDRVKTHHLDTVAIPAISSGLFNFPLHTCADTIVTAVKHYFENSSPHDYIPTEVLFVNIDEPTVKEMDRACRNLLRNPAMSYSQAATNHGKGADKTTAAMVKVGNVRVILRKGRIEEQQTDVIVNSVANRKLDVGAISKALLQKAGPQLQQEMLNAQKSGSIVITRGCGLQCNEVFHTDCSQTSKAKGVGQNLSTSVKECLWTAVMRHHSSIAFPAIATGVLGLSKSEAARTMLSEVNTFGWNVRRPMEVHFVIFPSDKDMFKVFENEMKLLPNAVSQGNNASWPGGTSSETSEYMLQHPTTEQQVWKNKDEVGATRASAPDISLIGPSNETTQEAMLWLSDVLTNKSGVTSICNNFIQHFGEQDFGQLRHRVRPGMQMEEFLEKGRAGITISGGSTKDLAACQIEAEAILCKVLRDFEREEADAIRALLPNTKVFCERKPLDKHDNEFRSICSVFHHQYLQVQKVEKVENAALEMLFETKKVQLHSSKTRTMYQRLPAQFCETVIRIGFHAECAPPDDPTCGEGIYFAGSVQKAMNMWTGQKEKYMYFVLAEVITGKSTSGKPGLVLPPLLGSDTFDRYDSVDDGADIVVIFSSYQAVPKFIITCKTT